MPRCLGLIAVALAFVACQQAPIDEDRDRPDEALKHSVACDKWGAIGADVGCGRWQYCEIDARCEEQARAYFDCIAEDLSQCLCENLDDLNCEGAFKPNEGPARCIAEHEQFERCRVANIPAGPELNLPVDSGPTREVSQPVQHL